MAGLFTTPEQVRQEQQKQLMEQANVMFDDPIARASYMATAGVAPSIGGLFGVQDTRQQQAAKVQELTNSVPFNENTQPEQYYTDLARKLINAGMTQAGNEALALARQAKGKDSTYTQKLTAGDKAAIRDATNQANSATLEADDAINLAIRYAEERPSGGVFGSAMSGFRKFVGGTNEVDLLKANFNKLRMSGVLKSLPPGPASDKDIENASKGFPTENFGTEEIVSWLKGYAKAKRIEAGYRDFYAQYVSDNFGDSSGVNKAWREHFEANVDKYWIKEEQAEEPKPGVPEQPEGMAPGQSPGASRGTATVPAPVSFEALQRSPATNEDIIRQSTVEDSIGGA